VKEGLSLEVPRAGLCIAQPKGAFRYGSEPFWLSGLALEMVPDAIRALDLGTGSGIIAGLLASEGLTVVGIDNHEDWLPAWHQTVSRSEPVGSFSLVQTDVRAFECIEKFDLVLSNPPFFPAGSGPVSPNQWKAAARSELSATLADFVRAGLIHLAKSGKMLVVVPRERVEDVVVSAKAVGGHHARTVFIGARRVIVVLDWQSSSHISVSVDDHGPEVEGWYRRVGCKT
jgi:tRNA1(Val) A37 N6-methylase TrmN6